jgi:hypothetical protein
MDDKIKILFLASNPTASGRLRLDEEYAQVKEALHHGENRDSFELIAEFATTSRRLIDALLRHKPHIVHFSGHGDQQAGGIVLDDGFGNVKLIDKKDLTRLLNVLKDNIFAVFLNSCYSADQADALAGLVDYSIVINNPIGDNAAINFAATFYQALSFDRTIVEAFEVAAISLNMNGLTGSTVPELRIRQGIEKPASVCAYLKHEVKRPEPAPSDRAGEPSINKGTIITAGTVTTLNITNNQ